MGSPEKNPSNCLNLIIKSLSIEYMYHLYSNKCNLFVNIL